MHRKRKIECRKISALKPHPHNVRTHPARQIRLLVNSIKYFGMTSPPLIDENDIILAGHARVVAGGKAGLEETPVIVLRGLSEARKRAYVLADNKIAELAGYDHPGLGDELRDLAPLLTAEGLNLELTGFEPAEIDALFADLVDEAADPDETLPVLSQNAVTRRGDLWIMGGKHRLSCDDARRADYPGLMHGEQAGMLFSDLPYNLDLTKVVGRGRIKHGNFAMASGEMSRPQFTSFLEEALGPASENAVDGALCYFCMDWRHQREILDAGEKVFGGGPKALCVWVKTNGGQGSLYRSQHELIYVYKRGEARHLNNVELGRHGRNRSNVWSYPGVNTFRSGRLDDLAAHPTVKPVALVADAIRDCTRRGDIVLDPFTGVGTTILAAEKVGRRGYGIEINPLYVDAAIRRWMTATKTDAVLEGTRKIFDEVMAERSRERRPA